MKPWLVVCSLVALAAVSSAQEIDSSCTNFAGQYQASVEYGFVDNSVKYGCDTGYRGGFVIVQNGCSFSGTGGSIDTVNGPESAIQMTGSFSGSSGSFTYTCTGCSGSAHGTMTFDGTKFSGSFLGNLAGLIFCDDPNSDGKQTWGDFTLTPFPEPEILDHGMTHGLDTRNNPIDHVTSFLTTDVAAYGFLVVGAVEGPHTINLNFRGGATATSYHLESPPITINGNGVGGNWIAEYGLRIMKQEPTDPDPTQLVGNWTCQILLDGNLVETENFSIAAYCARCHARITGSAPPGPVSIRDPGERP